MNDMRWKFLSAYANTPAHVVRIKNLSAAANTYSQW